MIRIEATDPLDEHRKRREAHENRSRPEKKDRKRQSRKDKIGDLEMRRYARKLKREARERKKRAASDQPKTGEPKR